MRFFSIAIITFFTIACSTAQERKVGGRCEGCEALFEYGDRQLDATDTLPGFEAAREKIKLSGTVFKSDGKTPAENVIIYVYQTDQKGIYPTKGNEIGWGKRHGYIRGWMKTDDSGKYSFYTFRPASYPNTTVAQHIHITVKEPGLIPYYIDDYNFADDPNLNEGHSSNHRGGNGLVKLKKSDNGLLAASRDIILGKHIPGY
ncbi:MAG: intradiol ring-cleavage dioxygenase [Fulvivirga sp.]